MPGPLHVQNICILRKASASLNMRPAGHKAYEDLQLLRPEVHTTVQYYAHLEDAGTGSIRCGEYAWR